MYNNEGISTLQCNKIKDIIEHIERIAWGRTNTCSYQIAKRSSGRYQSQEHNTHLPLELFLRTLSRMSTLDLPFYSSIHIPRDARTLSTPSNA